MSDTSQSPLRGLGFAFAAFGLFATHDAVIKLLGMVRNPVERAYARFLGRTRDGLEKRTSFAANGTSFGIHAAGVMTGTPGQSATGTS